MNKTNKSTESNLVFVCSPYRDNPASIKGTELYCRHLLLTGEIPIAPHLYFTRFLDDAIQTERNKGIRAGRDLMRLCCRMDVLTQWGTSEGMQGDLQNARLCELRIFEIESIITDIKIIGKCEWAV